MPKIGRFWLSLSLYYTPTHTWAKPLPDGDVKVGMDDFGQEMAGDLTRIRLFPEGHEVAQFKPFGTVESMKWTGPLSCPFSGKIKEINHKVTSDPKLINSDSYGEGWIAIITPSKQEDEINNLLFEDKAVEQLKKDIEEIAKEKY